MNIDCAICGEKLYDAPKAMNTAGQWVHKECADKTAVKLSDAPVEQVPPGAMHPNDRAMRQLQILMSIDESLKALVAIAKGKA